MFGSIRMRNMTNDAVRACAEQGKSGRPSTPVLWQRGSVLIAAALFLCIVCVLYYEKVARAPRVVDHSPQVQSLSELISAPLSYVAKQDIARMNLLCAEKALTIPTFSRHSALSATATVARQCLARCHTVRLAVNVGRLVRSIFIGCPSSHGLPVYE